MIRTTSLSFLFDFSLFGRDEKDRVFRVCLCAGMIVNWRRHQSRGRRAHPEFRFISVCLSRFFFSLVRTYLIRRRHKRARITYKRINDNAFTRAAGGNSICGPYAVFRCFAGGSRRRRRARFEVCKKYKQPRNFRKPRLCHLRAPAVDCWFVLHAKDRTIQRAPADKRRVIRKHFTSFPMANHPPQSIQRRSVTGFAGTPASPTWKKSSDAKRLVSNESRSSLNRREPTTLSYPNPPSGIGNISRDRFEYDSFYTSIAFGDRGNLSKTFVTAWIRVMTRYSIAPSVSCYNNVRLDGICF